MRKIFGPVGVFVVIALISACGGGSSKASHVPTSSTQSQDGFAAESLSKDGNLAGAGSTTLGYIDDTADAIGSVIASSPDGYKASFQYTVSLSEPILNIEDAPPGYVLFRATPSGKVEVSNKTSGGRTLHFDWSSMSSVGIGYLPKQYGSTSEEDGGCDLMRGIYCFLESLGYPSDAGVTDISEGLTAFADLSEIRVVSDDVTANSHKLLENDGHSILNLINDGTPPVIDVDVPDDWTVDSCTSASGIIVTTSSEYGMPAVACTDGIPQN